VVDRELHTAIASPIWEDHQRRGNRFRGNLPRLWVRLGLGIAAGGVAGCRK
jgi:hypothetical protein